LIEGYQPNKAVQQAKIMSLILYAINDFSRSSSVQGKQLKQPSLVQYDVVVNDRFATCELKQTYNIPFDTIESQYEFPVDCNSAFCSLEIVTPRETIKGIVQEKVQAQKTYDRAVSEGKQAFLAEESSEPDVYRLKMGNLLKEDLIVVTFRYQTEVGMEGCDGKFYIPTFISPRYGDRDGFIVAKEHKLVANIRVNKYDRRIMPCIDDLQISSIGDSVIFTYNTDKPIERDIELKFGINRTDHAYRFGDVAMIQFRMPDPKEDAMIREVVFVVDCSGSMRSGRRIENARAAVMQCLERMKGVTYRYNVIKYGDRFDLLSPKMLTSDDISIGLEYCKKIDADMGGTETFKALIEARKLSPYVLLITDGDTVDNEAMHKFCRDPEKGFRNLSVLGIGSGINRNNINELARCGHGLARFSQDDTSIIENIDELFKAMGVPTVGNPKCNLDVDILRTHKSMIMGQFFVMYALLGDRKVDTIQIEGVEFKLEDLPQSYDADALCCLIAKRIIAENPDVAKDMLLGLALKYNIITKYTSLVAVGKEQVVTSHNYNEERMSKYAPTVLKSWSGGSRAELQSITESAIQKCMSYSSEDISDTEDCEEEQMQLCSASFSTRRSSMKLENRSEVFIPKSSVVKSSGISNAFTGVKDVIVSAATSTSNMIQNLITNLGTTETSMTGIDKIGFDDLMKTYFDYNKGLFKMTIQDIISVKRCWNEEQLTMYVLGYCQINRPPDFNTIRLLVSNANQHLSVYINKLSNCTNIDAVVQVCDLMQPIVKDMDISAEAFC